MLLQPRRAGDGDRPEGDVVDHLLACHERIRGMVALIHRMATTPDAPVGEVQLAAERVRRYFTEALPNHVADEDLDVAPALHGKDGDVDWALATMHADHLEHVEPIGRLVALCRELEADPARLAADAAELTALGEVLDAAFTRHLELEERVVFPAIRALLDAPTRAALMASARARRA